MFLIKILTNSVSHYPKCPQKHQEVKHIYFKESIATMCGSNTVAFILDDKKGLRKCAFF